MKVFYGALFFVGSILITDVLAIEENGWYYISKKKNEKQFTRSTKETNSALDTINFKNYSPEIINLLIKFNNHSSIKVSDTSGYILLFRVSDELKLIVDHWRRLISCLNQNPSKKNIDFVTIKMEQDENKIRELMKIVQIVNNKNKNLLYYENYNNETPYNTFNNIVKKIEKLQKNP